MDNNLSYELDDYDLSRTVQRLPDVVASLMQAHKNIVLAGGFIRAAVLGEEPSDIDLFLSSEQDAHALVKDMEVGFNCIAKVNETPNALTVTELCELPIQFVTRWRFDDARSVAAHFDFTVCQAAIYFDGRWRSRTCERFYQDLAARRLVYTNPPSETAEPGGSLLRLLKYYRRGYSAPLESIGSLVGAIIADLPYNPKDVKPSDLHRRLKELVVENLREVDPSQER